VIVRKRIKSVLLEVGQKIANKGVDFNILKFKYKKKSTEHSSIALDETII
jgi:hypothetical protein